MSIGGPEIGGNSALRSCAKLASPPCRPVKWEISDFVSCGEAEKAENDDGGKFPARISAT
jgi:hypothetical protein